MHTCKQLEIFLRLLLIFNSAMAGSKPVMQKEEGWVRDQQLHHHHPLEKLVATKTQTRNNNILALRVDGPPAGGRMTHKSKSQTCLEAIKLMTIISTRNYWNMECALHI